MPVVFNMVPEVGAALMAINGLSLGDAAKAYINLGIPIFPLKRWGGTRNFMRRNGPGHATLDPVRIKIIWGLERDANIGIPTGARGGIIAYQIKGEKGRASFSRLQREYGEFPDTASVLSPFGDRYLLFSSRFTELGRRIAPGIRILGWRERLVAPPSNEIGYGRFLWERDLPIADLPLRLLGATLNGQV